MKTKLLTSICAIFLIIACGNDQKKTETTSISVEEATEASGTNDKEAIATEKKAVTLDDQIKIIKTNFTTIESQLTSLDKKTATEEISGGITEFEGFFKDNKPVKLVKMEAAGHSSMQIAYYFHENELFFIHEQEYGEASLHGPYTGKEKRFYIADGELIRVLKKEKTVKTGDLEMANVPNVDVTKNFKGSSVVTDYTKSAREASALLLAESIGLNNGRWISKEDSNAGIEIKDGKLIMFYKSAEVNSNDVFDYKLTEHEGVEYLTLTDKTGDELKYSILEYSEDVFVMSYLARGNRLTYVKEK